ncbi:EAL domain-containing protein [Curvibacter sp. HBC61]|uniref:EAL domain-containing protein n=1 Tax=Curvibacter cyanobacteriorum TaxID=3026422 RepID=A0ABT5MU80_9BURK|nr:EAL domain-containing protein [Curvibacter sp. HBC61]MDD0837597.1 EAL domain-containing protein [Curvibacter sp. HBC61]
MVDVSTGFQRETYAANAIVFRAGEAGEAAYVIDQGCVEILLGPEGDQRRVDVLATGAMFGEIALLDGLPRSATVRTLVPTSLIRIERGHVEGLLRQADPVVQYLVKLLLGRVRSARTDGPPLLGLIPQGQDALSELDPSEQLHNAAVRTLSLAQSLSDGIRLGQLEVHYQAIVLLSDHAVAGFEALVRWRHPVLGLISPDEFIPLAEKTGLIHRVGEFVLRQAVADWAQLRPLCQAGTGHIPFMSVNLSAPELCAPGVVQRIQACLEAHQMAPEELHIELTETIIISSVEVVTHVVQGLRNMGVGVALDDFGTGYAGLDYLQTLPFSCLKIDRSFVERLPNGERSVQIVKSALALSDLLGLSTVAEGIEDAATADLLRSLGCTYAQGFHFARPQLCQALIGPGQVPSGEGRS